MPKFADFLYRYFEMLYDINRNLIMCCGVSLLNNSGQYERPLQEIIDNIPKLIPYGYRKEQEKYIIIKHDGLLEFSDEISFLVSDYEQLLSDNYDFLSDIKAIRNKFEHKMHGVRLTEGGSSSFSYFDMTYSIGNQEIALKAEDFIKLIKQLNVLFSKLQTLVDTYSYKNKEQHNSFYRKLTYYNFCNFNQIYDSSLLRIVGQAMFPF